MCENKEPSSLLNALRGNQIDFIALAGFLRLLPTEIISAYKGRVFNIHPSLLPKYGGKGMYGLRVHEAVLQNGDTESGITIHEVNESYDQGNIIFSEPLPISYAKNQLTPEQLSLRIRALEHEHYPRILAEVINERIAKESRKRRASLSSYST